MTDNQRLARVLEILARVAERTPSAKWYDAGFPVELAIDALWRCNIAEAHSLATEAARLAGVPVSPWVLADWSKPGGLPEEYEPVIVTARTPDGGLYTGPAWLLEVDPPDDGSDAPPEYAAMFHDGPDSGSDLYPEVIAWTRDWPAPYRPEETTDEQV